MNFPLRFLTHILPEGLSQCSQGQAQYKGVSLQYWPGVEDVSKHDCRGIPNSLQHCSGTNAVGILGCSTREK